ncbi:MAG: acetyl-CoA carboxylase, carboxyltransferase subunit beta [Candidatus Sericytochromatia bacterium]|nr:acetyl-CoA carboxylase, carboxyltransferase subunit beta [Candidatus Sericytochromatia bacterium]
MTLRDWFETRKKERSLVDTERIRRDMPDGLWTKCPSCGEAVYNKDLEANLMVCPPCGHHFRLDGRTRLAQLVDPGSFTERGRELRSEDPLAFVDTKPYARRLAQAHAADPTAEAVLTGIGQIHGHRLALAVMDFSFMGGSMGSVVGERVARIIDAARVEHLDLVVVTASGGARMQEGTLSLMQMAKTSTAMARLHEAGRLAISVLADPTTGGVSASFATLSDIIIAEPGATIGFAGRRVIEQTIRQKTPAEFQTAEWLMKHGQVDMLVPRHKLRDTIAQLITMHRGTAA